MITLKRGQKAAIPFTINDTANGLAGARVTWEVSPALKVVSGVPQSHLAAAVLTKASALGGSSAAVTILSQSAAQITGTINIVPADFTALADATYAATLWVDDGAGNDRPCTDCGFDKVTILETAPRT